MITYLGSYSVGGLFPAVVGFMAGARAKLSGQLTGAMRVSGLLTIKPPSVAARAAISARLAAQMAITAPSVRFNLTANALVIAALKAQLALYARLLGAFGRAGVDVFVYQGAAQAFGGEANAAIGGGLPGGGSRPDEHVDALVFATRYPEVFAALREVFL